MRGSQIDREYPRIVSCNEREIVDSGEMNYRIGISITRGRARGLQMERGIADGAWSGEAGSGRRTSARRSAWEAVMMMVKFVGTGYSRGEGRNL